MGRHPAERDNGVALNRIDAKLDEVVNLVTVINAAASDNAHLRVMFANELDLFHRVLVKRATGHATAIAIRTEWRQVFVCHMNR